MSSDENPSRAKVAAVVTFYMVSALVMVFVNKAVLNSTPDLPFSFLFIQIVIAVLLLHLCAFLFDRGPAGEPKKPLAKQFELPEVTRETALKLLPLVGVGIISLVFNTLCLRSVDASFFQIARGLLIPSTIAVSAIQSRTIPRSTVFIAAGIVTIGFFIGVIPLGIAKQYLASAAALPGYLFGTGDTGASTEAGDAAAAAATEVVGEGIDMAAEMMQDMDFDEFLEGETVELVRAVVRRAADAVAGAVPSSVSFSSIMYGSLSALLTAIHAILVKDGAKVVEGSVVKLGYWTNFMSAFIMIPFIILNGELPLLFALLSPPENIDASTLDMARLRGRDSVVIDQRSTFLFGSLITGVFGFFLCIAGLLSIKVTSPTTHMFSSAFRSVLQTLLGVWIFSDVVDAGRGTSIAVITVGTVYYTWAQSKRPPQAVAIKGDGGNGENDRRDGAPLLPMSSVHTANGGSGAAQQSEVSDWRTTQQQQQQQAGGERDAWEEEDHGDVLFSARSSFDNDHRRADSKNANEKLV